MGCAATWKQDGSASHTEVDEFHVLCILHHFVNKKLKVNQKIYQITTRKKNGITESYFVLNAVCPRREDDARKDAFREQAV